MMEINAKKMKVVVIGKNEEVKCQIRMIGARLEHITQYKYLGTVTATDGICDTGKVEICMRKVDMQKITE